MGKAKERTVAKTKSRFKQGKLRSGPGGDKVTDPKQATAIALSKGRRAQRKG